MKTYVITFDKVVIDVPDFVDKPGHPDLVDYINKELLSDYFPGYIGVGWGCKEYEDIPPETKKDSE